MIKEGKNQELNQRVKNTFIPLVLSDDLLQAISEHSIYNSTKQQVKDTYAELITDMLLSVDIETLE